MSGALVIYMTVVGRALQGAAVLISSMTICSGAAVTLGILEGKTMKRVGELALLGTAAGFLIGVPLTLSALIVLQRV
jgi:hypothetical protein